MEWKGLFPIAFILPFFKLITRFEGVKITNTSSIDFIFYHIFFILQLKNFPESTWLLLGLMDIFSLFKRRSNKKCEQADFKDCRINAYPETIERDGFLVQPPNFVFIDLDLSTFNDGRKKLDKVKDSTLRKLEQLNGSHPTVSLQGMVFIFTFRLIGLLSETHDSCQEKLTLLRYTYHRWMILYYLRSIYFSYYLACLFVLFALNWKEINIKNI